MMFQDLRREHPGKVCLCRPHLRDLKSGGRVLSWKCLQVVNTVDEARAALVRFDLDGVTDAVAISTAEEITITESLAARFFRIYFGME